MKRLHPARKFLAILLSLTILFPVFSLSAFAQDAAPKSGADYPAVFVHGFSGWGDEDLLSCLLPMWGGINGDMTRYLQCLGYDTFSASIGPISSVHDRCCELFAQLIGSRVDYGQAHADKCTAEYASLGYSLTHSRYGRDYTGHPGVENWGPIYDAGGKVTGWYDNKINLVGHSLGAPTALELIRLLADGDAEEQAWGKAQAVKFGGDWHDYISPLFWGDYNGEYLIHSVTSLAGVLNGITFTAANEDFTDFLGKAFLMVANTVGLTDLGAFYDIQLEQFGLTKIPGSDVYAKFSFLNQQGFLAGSDHAFHDLTIDGINAFKQGWKTYDNIYYFSHPCNSSHKFSSDLYIPNKILSSVLLPFSVSMGSYLNPSEQVIGVDGTPYTSVDRAWLPNDGLANTISTRYPFGAPHQSYDPQAIVPGIWYVYPDLNQQHLEIIGVTTYEPIMVRRFYSHLMEDLCKTTPIQNASASMSLAI